MKKNDSAVVVFSGGQDSTTCLFWALEKFDHVSALTFAYGQRHAAEIACAKDIARKAGVPLRILEVPTLNDITSNALTRNDIEITDQNENNALPSTFVPGRNHLFLSFAAIYAKEIGAKHLVTGVCETDFSGYPDCRDVFIKSLNVTLNLAMDTDFVIHTPLMWLNKTATWALADQLGKLETVQHDTLTCYEGIKGTGCTTCPACKLRAAGLAAYLEQKAGAPQ
ncbi:7-cyano-7-deazaguanine synthase QueC [Bacillus sp. FSL W7-1360]